MQLKIQILKWGTALRKYIAIWQSNSVEYHSAYTNRYLFICDIVVKLFSNFISVLSVFRASMLIILIQHFGLNSIPYWFLITIIGFYGTWGILCHFPHIYFFYISFSNYRSVCPFLRGLWQHAVAKPTINRVFTEGTSIV